MTTSHDPPALKSRHDVDIPSATATVQVRALDTGTRLYLRPGLFWEPILEGFDGPSAPIYCFLVSNGDRHVVFDLGVRKDWENYAPRIVALIKATTKVSSCTRDIVSILDEDESDLDIRSSDIEAIVWSHSHFDHAGDPSRFPPKTELIVGPGVKDASWPGYPSNPDGVVLDSDAAGRQVREIAFDGLSVGGFDAHDFFGDGSFYLLDAPGHAPGHLCALARTSADPPHFIFMGADACHHPGVLRPSQQLQLPTPITRREGSADLQGGCPGELLDHIRQWHDADRPFFQVAKGPLFPDHDAAVATIAKMQRLDAMNNVFVLIAHDNSLQGHVPLFPDTMNAWCAGQGPSSTQWSFCQEFSQVKPKLREASAHGKTGENSSASCISLESVGAQQPYCVGPAPAA